MTKVGFVGCGQMATALARACVRGGVFAASDITLSDPNQAALDAVGKDFGTTKCNKQIFEENDVVVLAVKPQFLDKALEGLRLDVQPLVVSIMAGVTLETLQQRLSPILGGDNNETRIVRVMPNICCLVGEAASAFSHNAQCTDSDVDIVQKMLNAAGTAFSVPENLLDAVTGVSGSGPAYAMLMIEAMADAGVSQGLPRNVATALAAQTLVGAGRMVLETKTHPMVLKDQVCSPGGTTIAAVAALERGGLRSAVIDAVQASSKRAAELGSN